MTWQATDFDLDVDSGEASLRTGAANAGDDGTLMSTVDRAMKEGNMMKISKLGTQNVGFTSRDRDLQVERNIKKHVRRKNSTLKKKLKDAKLLTDLLVKIE